VHYLALGDSISIDRYPALETGIEGLGAASLFHRNDDRVWPDFRGRDLSTLHPGITIANLTEDGATSADVLERQLPRVRGKADIITLTAGGNDLLMSLGGRSSPVAGILERIRRIVRAIPEGLLIIGTVYDPTDGTKVLEGAKLEREAVWLEEINEGIRALAGGRVRIADIHRHFLGHGLTAAAGERWYWSGSIIEPGARGASEVRRLWLEALG
jgi:lysophospholipase L1-like esterase